MIERPSEITMPYNIIRQYISYAGFRSSWKKPPLRIMTKLEFIEFLDRNNAKGEWNYPQDAPLVAHPTKWQIIKEALFRKDLNSLKFLVCLVTVNFIQFPLSGLHAAIIIGSIIGACLLIDILEYLAFKDFKQFFNRKNRSHQNEQ